MWNRNHTACLKECGTLTGHKSGICEGCRVRRCLSCNREFKPRKNQLYCNEKCTDAKVRLRAMTHGLEFGFI